MKSLKFTLISIFTFLFSSVSFAHHTIHPHSHAHAADSHSSVPGAIIFAIIVIVGMVIFAKKYVQPKEHKE